MPPVLDQVDTSSCVGHSTAEGFAWDLRRLGYGQWLPSRLGIYYGARAIEGYTAVDGGCEIRNAVKVLATQGAAPEAFWPFNPKRVLDAPSPGYYAEARNHLAVSYERVDQTETAIKRAIYAGFPIIFGISIFDSFESDAVATSGVVPYPKNSESNLGGHAILMCGYGKTRVTFRNSWGPKWGRAGNATIGLDYVLNPDLAGDFWIVKAIERDPRTGDPLPRALPRAA
jgi:C1A family cysteine protease